MCAVTRNECLKKGRVGGRGRSIFENDVFSGTGEVPWCCEANVS